MAIIWRSSYPRFTGACEIYYGFDLYAYQGIYTRIELYNMPHIKKACQNNSIGHETSELLNVALPFSVHQI